MSGDSSEEKTLPASPKKLRDARRRGEVPRSRDMVVAGSALAVILYLAVALPSIIERFEDMFADFSRLVPLPFRQALGIGWGVTVDGMTLILLPLLGAAAAGAIFGGLLATKGPVLSMTPIAPRFDRINPAAGLKRMFRLSQLVELLKSALKIVVILAVFLLVMAYLADSLVSAPACGLRCLTGVSAALFGMLAAAIIVVYLASALFDMPLQARLFQRDMRMSMTEQRRERKDVEGDPHVESALKERRQESGSGVTGVRFASLLITDESGNCVGLRYVAGETPAPVIVCRAGGHPATALVTQARARNIRVMHQPFLCAELMERGTPIGEFVPEDLFGESARVLMAAGII